MGKDISNKEFILVILALLGLTFGILFGTIFLNNLMADSSHEKEVIKGLGYTLTEARPSGYILFDVNSLNEFIDKAEQYNTLEIYYNDGDILHAPYFWFVNPSMKELAYVYTASIFND